MLLQLKKKGGGEGCRERGEEEGISEEQRGDKLEICV